MLAPLLEFRNVSKSFGTNKVLDKVNLTLDIGHTTAIIGKSGAGKSVFLKHIIGLLQPDSGEIIFNGRNLSKTSKEEYRKIKHELSYMFQHNALFDSLTVFENIALPLVERQMPKDEIKERVMQKIKQLELEESINSYPSELSGGMQKRVAFARAIVTQPKLVLFDEPTTGLDPIRKNAVLSMIAQYQRQFEFTAVIVSHDIPEIFYIADKVIVIENAQIIFDGTPPDLEKMQNPMVREFLESRKNLRENLEKIGRTVQAFN